MVRRQGPQLSSLMYDKACVADDLMRPEAADPIRARSANRSINRPDRFVHPMLVDTSGIILRREASIDCRTGRRSDSRLPPSLSRVMPSAASERFSEMLGCPISRSLTTSCVCLELRPLPSTGIDRLQRYCEPLRHPRAPGLSLTGLRLDIPDHASGLPVLRALSLCTCCHHYPGAAAGCIPRSSHPSVSAFPDTTVESACTSIFSRFARRSLTLRPAHSHGHRIS